MYDLSASASLIHKNDRQCEDYVLYNKEQDPNGYCQIRIAYVDGIKALQIMVNDVVYLYNQYGQQKSTLVALG